MTRLLFVLSSKSVGISSQQETGVDLAQLVTAFQTFTEQGMDVVLALTGESTSFDKEFYVTRLSINYPEFYGRYQKELQAIYCLQDIHPEEFHGLVFLGGVGPFWSFYNQKTLYTLANQFLSDDKLVITIGSGSTALLQANVVKKNPLLSGKILCCLTHEEACCQYPGIQLPFMLEAMLAEQGAQVVKAPLLQSNVVVCGNLITAQNSTSIKDLAAKTKEKLSA